MIYTLISLKQLLVYQYQKFHIKSAKKTPCSNIVLMLMITIWIDNVGLKIQKMMKTMHNHS